MESSFCVDRGIVDFTNLRPNALEAQAEPGHFSATEKGLKQWNGAKADVRQMVFYWILKQNISLWSSRMERQFINNTSGEK